MALLSSSRTSTALRGRVSGTPDCRPRPDTGDKSQRARHSVRDSHPGPGWPLPGIYRCRVLILDRVANRVGLAGWGGLDGSVMAPSSANLGSADCQWRRPPACRKLDNMSDETVVRERGEPEAAWPSFALPRGTVVNGYRLERILGNGGFGITYLAADLLQQRFAIKEYYPQQFATRHGTTVGPTTAEDAPLFDECRERFLREAQALVLLGRSSIAGDSIVRVQTYFEAFGTCFLVMDYIEGDSLASILRQQPGGLPPARLRSLLTQLLSSLRIVHHAGLLHRDIKPANLIVRPDDRLVLIDFGATRQTSRSDSTTFTQI
jgi:predicted Ser/Thr protein kinase